MRDSNTFKHIHFQNTGLIAELNMWTGTLNFITQQTNYLTFISDMPIVRNLCHCSVKSRDTRHLCKQYALTYGVEKTCCTIRPPCLVIFMTLGRRKKSIRLFIMSNGMHHDQLEMMNYRATMNKYVQVQKDLQ